MLAFWLWKIAKKYKLYGSDLAFTLSKHFSYLAIVFKKTEILCDSDASSEFYCISFYMKNYIVKLLIGAN